MNFNPYDQTHTYISFFFRSPGGYRFVNNVLNMLYIFLRLSSICLRRPSLISFVFRFVATEAIFSFLWEQNFYRWFSKKKREKIRLAYGDGEKNKNKSFTGERTRDATSYWLSAEEFKKNRATIRNHSIEVVSAVSTVDRRMKETETWTRLHLSDMQKRRACMFNQCQTLRNRRENGLKKTFSMVKKNSEIV